MCDVADHLRMEWYKTVMDIPESVSHETREMLFRAQRDAPEYRMALKALREHICSCEICHKGLRVK